MPLSSAVEGIQYFAVLTGFMRRAGMAQRGIGDLAFMSSDPMIVERLLTLWRKIAGLVGGELATT